MTDTRHATQRPSLAARLRGLALPVVLGVAAAGGLSSLFQPAFTLSGESTIVGGVPASPAAERRIEARLAPAAPARPVEPASAARPGEEAEALFLKGKALAAAGDFAAARLLLARASDAGHPGATFALASTYDPNILASVKVRGLVGEPEQAKALYAKALAAGLQDARRRMAALGG